MNSATPQTIHKLGANRKEIGRKSRRARNFSESSDIHEDRGTLQSKFAQPAHLRFRRDGARSVFVVSTFNDWEPQRLALRPDNEGGWETELLLPPGDYEYRFFVDGEWTDDPLACRVVSNPYGSVNAVLHVHGRWKETE